ncbi:MAG: FecR domain-containing protein, partial [Pseudomonadota bacterium]
MKHYAVFTTFFLLGVLSHLPIAAQTSIGCVQRELSDPPRVVYQCAGGIILEAEAASTMGIVGAQENGRPNDVEVTSDAILIDVSPGTGPFQIRTPHAIAAVRGTEYVVDVTG